MQRTASIAFALCFFIASFAIAQPSVPQGGVVSAASLLPAGAPGYQVAPGSIVSIFGSNLATSAGANGVGASALPLPTSLGGASVTIGGVTAGLFFVSNGQINAQVPYTVALGASVPVVVTTSAGSSSPSTVPVVAAAPAIFTYSQNGLGNAAAQNYVSAGSTPANGFTTAIAQGGILIVYGTGGGSLGSSTPANGAACGGGQFPGSVSATIAGQSVTVQYAGCAPGFVGLDQWNIQLPNTIPSGCSVPIQVSVGGVLSNAATIAVSSSGNCATAATGQPFAGPGQSLGSVQIINTAISIPGLFSQTSGSASGSFQKYGATAFSNMGGIPPAQAGCFVQTTKSSSSSPSTATVLGTTGLDAGTITLKAPSGTYTLTENPTGTYSTAVSGIPALTAGTYTVTATGASGGVGPFTSTLNVPGILNVTNPGFTGTSFSQSQGLSATMTCPDPAGEIVALVLSTTSNNIQGEAICTFTCSSNIVIPSSVLKQLPVSASGQAEVGYFFLPPNNNAGVTSAQFTATGLNFGLFYMLNYYFTGNLTLTQ